ncbi:MAG: 4-hydroxythreonine-4-phosphate dehydrogenase PdxA [Steroidobacteraceae bacterium]
MSAREPVPTIAVTTGEPAGIGPDLCGALLDDAPAGRIVLLGDRTLYARVPGLGRRMAALPDYSRSGDARPGIELLHVPLRAPCIPGRLDPANAPYVLELLDRAVDGCLDGEFHAMVTAPVHKGVINQAGVPFTGHTEHLAARTAASLPVMMLTGGNMRVVLATTHLPLKDVSAAVTPQRLEAVLRILHGDLQRRFGLAEPNILVCGLNPHAGEGGYLGREEIDVIAPTLERLQREGMRLAGPVPADTAFLPERLAGCDAVLAMYHDQGLPVLKHASFGHAVNVTLGLPIIRTSVDHGTALDLAGTGRADAGSLRAALALAATLCTTRRP